MRYAIVSDIHSNWEALSAVFADIDSAGVDTVLCLGDTIGYGANPNECLDLIRERCTAVVAGNHDWAAIGLTSTEYFNPFARQSAAWTASALRDDHGEYIRGLPLSAVVEDMLLVHSTPIVPEEWRYVLNSMDAAAELAAIDEPIAFIGHSHLPAVFERDQDSARMVPFGDFELDRPGRYLVNVGSVGQPRDRIPAAAYALCTRTPGHVRVELRRIPYDIPRAQSKILDAGLPRILADRLGRGE